MATKLLVRRKPNIEPETNLGNSSFCHPTWRAGRKRRVVVLDPYDRNLELPFIEHMDRFIGKTIAVEALRYKGRRDWWSGRGFLWHTSWLGKA